MSAVILISPLLAVVLIVIPSPPTIFSVFEALEFALNVVATTAVDAEVALAPIASVPLFTVGIVIVFLVVDAVKSPCVDEHPLTLST